ncbi:MAG: hypothetical protein AB1938_08375 [Myxococcota bacterium]
MGGTTEKSGLPLPATPMARTLSADVPTDFTRAVFVSFNMVDGLKSTGSGSNAMAGAMGPPCSRSVSGSVSGCAD